MHWIPKLYAVKNWVYARFAIGSPWAAAHHKWTLLVTIREMKETTSCLFIAHYTYTGGLISACPLTMRGLFSQLAEYNHFIYTWNHIQVYYILYTQCCSGYNINLKPSTVCMPWLLSAWNGPNHSLYVCIQEALHRPYPWLWNKIYTHMPQHAFAMYAVSY